MKLATFSLAGALLFTSSFSLLAATESDSSSLFETTYDSLITPGTPTTPATTDLLSNRPITGPDGNNGFALTGINDGLAGTQDSGATTSAASITAGFSTTNAGANDTFYGNGDLGGTVLTGNPIITITLNTSATGSTTGYTLSSIDTIAGWQNFDASFSDQAYSVYYSTVGAPTTFSLLASVNYHPFGNQGDETTGPALGNDNTDSGSSDVTLTNLDAANVAALQFVLTPSTGTYTVPGSSTPSLPDTQGGIVIREFQAFGVATVAPEPSTYAMLLAGFAFLAICVRRRLVA